MTNMLNALNAIRGLWAAFAILVAVSFLLAGCGGDGGGDDNGGGERAPAPAPTPAPTPTPGNGGGGRDMTINPNPNSLSFTVNDNCSDGRPINYRFFEQAGGRLTGRRWPGSGRVFVVRDGAQTHNLACNAGSNICYGAQIDGSEGYWGAGIDGDKSCSNCCRGCGSGQARISLGCPGGGGNDPDPDPDPRSGGGGDDRTANRSPETRGSIPEQTLRVGETETIDVSRYFTDPDGDRLSYSLTFSDGSARQVRASVSSGGSLRLQGVAAPGQTVRVIASDPDREHAFQDIVVRVTATTGGGGGGRSTRYIAIAHPSGDTFRGAATGRGDSAAEAERNAVNRCQQLLSLRCEVGIRGNTGCVAVARSECTSGSGFTCRAPAAGFAGGYSTRAEAQTAAIATCERSARDNTCRVATAEDGSAFSACAN